MPADTNPHTIAAKCHIPAGSYFATAGALWLETPAYVEAVKPFIAAEAIASHMPAGLDEPHESDEPSEPVAPDADGD